ncbi:MAG: phosphoribosylformylglycinamidine synthase subunit PurQ [Phycisphaerae bacterium]|nr:phosphoribosylformylglycinamidine synthase subunit PurQ [Phycisphaerae bacterium]
MSHLRAIVITAPGINCDLELVRAFEMAGAEPEVHLLKSLMRSPSTLDGARLIGLPGGFSFGDDIAAGRIMAQLIRRSISPALIAAIERGVPMICPCNGFQIAVQAGLLPGGAAEHGAADRGAAERRVGVAGSDAPAHREAPAHRDAPTPTVALAQNTDGKFHDRWTEVEIPSNTRCIWTKGLSSHAERTLPNAHGEGRFVASPEIAASLEANGQIALRYAEADDFNGSLGRIAGICDPSGVVLGLMPHPERFTRWTQHPRWTRLDASVRRGTPLGLAMFENAVRFVRERGAGDSTRRGARSAPAHSLLDRGLGS